jgi:hypothetical protein
MSAQKQLSIYEEFCLSLYSEQKYGTTMSKAQLEEELIRYAKGLPEDALQEILDFIQFLRQKRINKPADNLTAELSSLSASQTAHLEEEFEDYKKLYPRE